MFLNNKMVLMTFSKVIRTMFIISLFAQLLTVLRTKLISAFRIFQGRVGLIPEHL